MSDDQPSVQPMTRLTVNLIPKTVAALDQVTALNQENKTDAVNRALQMYAWLSELAAAGGAVMVTAGDGTTREVRFL